MNIRSLPAVLFAMAMWGFLFPGCAAISKSRDAQAEAKKDAYTDARSGVALPKEAGSLERVSIDDADPDKKPVSAHYASEGSLYLDAGIRILPALQIDPDQLLGQTIRSVESRSNFAQGDYRGLKAFGSYRAFCTECSFDRPESGDRVTFKIAIVPRGNYLLCFTFLVRASQEQEAQEVIDGFIQAILTRSDKKKVYMTPSATPSDEANGDN